MLKLFKAAIFSIVVKISSTFGVFTHDYKKFDPYNMDPDFKDKKVLTQLSQFEIAEVLCKSHTELYGKAPSKNRLALAWSQIALENNRGKNIWNYNLGNQGPFRMDQTYYHHKMHGWPYRSFEDFNSSAKSYWRVIENCKMASIAFDKGDPIWASRALKGCNYYSSDQKEYSKVLSSLYYEARKKILPESECG